MRVECLITSEGKERYMVVDDKGEPVEAALRYIKYKDNTKSHKGFKDFLYLINKSRTYDAKILKLE